MGLLIGIAVGLVVGVFIPGVLRKAKTWFVAESKTVEGDIAKKI